MTCFRTIRTANEVVQATNLEIAAYVKELKSRCSSSGGATRFSRLADNCSPTTAADGESEFRALARTRNDLLHRRISDLSASRKTLKRRTAQSRWRLDTSAVRSSATARRSRHN